MAENFPKLITDTNRRSRKLRRHQVEYCQKSTPIIMHTIFKLWKKQGENLGGTQRGKNTLCIKKQGKNYVRLSFRNHVSKRRVEWKISGVERKKLPTQNSVPSEIILQKWKRLKRIKKQAKDWEKIFAKHISEKELVSKIFMELLKLNNKKTKNPPPKKRRRKQRTQFKNEQKIRTDTSPRKTNKWQISTGKKCTTS